MKNNHQQPAKQFPVREGTEESSVLHDRQPPLKNKYPQPAEKDTQAQQQPEFTEEQPNRKSPNSASK